MSLRARHEFAERVVQRTQTAQKIKPLTRSSLTPWQRHFSLPPTPKGDAAGDTTRELSHAIGTSAIRVRCFCHER
jgi:hypothetical protein